MTGGVAAAAGVVGSTVGDCEFPDARQPASANPLMVRPAKLSMLRLEGFRLSLVGFSYTANLPMVSYVYSYLLTLAAIGRLAIFQTRLFPARMQVAEQDCHGQRRCFGRVVSRGPVRCRNGMLRM